VIRLHQHVPGWAEKTPWTADGESIDDILKTPWVQLYRKSAHGPFVRWSLSPSQPCSDGSQSRPLLMAEYDEGRRWTVVGYLEHDQHVIIELPEWKQCS
jgi:hypothetical protein